jgi:hypothetical protein
LCARRGNVQRKRDGEDQRQHCYAAQAHCQNS